MASSFEEKFVLSTDASSYSIGAFLEQKDIDGIFKPISYFSRKLKDAETRYSAYGKEALSVVSPIKNYRNYLYGTEFTVYTDNSAFAATYNNQEPTGRISICINLISESKFNIKHRKGIEKGAADYLPRNPVILCFNEENRLEDGDQALDNIKKKLSGNREANFKEEK
ncbi:Retrovirus-related Pol polyprotein from transposon 297 [Smittium mucronatum]|uniref:Retrovirus-related Pol polyprotein from transposon 297 n=1 Tax=Smittium mucronatum TaxID=133383 RepID=A0A1R0GLE0_9FUNG|nr:Retrovirus-related Pol polyprotein from transposon 297 [Smittium mucronatum]